MGSLDERLAKARNAQRPWDAPDYFEVGFDVAANIAREVVAEKDADLKRLDDEICDLDDKIAEKDAEIARLEATWKAERDLTNRTASRLFRERGAKQRAEAALAQPRKVTDAQRESIEAIRAKYGNPYTDNSFGADAIRYLLTVIESTDEPAAK